MSTTTTNYGLTKPAENENYDIGVFNDNFDTIDSALKSLDDDVQEIKEQGGSSGMILVDDEEDEELIIIMDGYESADEDEF